MKTIIIIIAALVILTALWGDISIAVQTNDIAQTRMILHRLGGRFAVNAKITPQWGAPERVGAHCYCDRIHCVSFSVAK